MVDSMSSLRASFSYNPPSTMDSNGPEGSSFPSYLPASNTPPMDVTGAIPSLHTQTHDLHLVGSSSFLGDENAAFTPSESVYRSDGEVLQLPSQPFHLLSSLSGSESSQGMNRSSRHSSPSLPPSHPFSPSPSRHSSPHCTHHCDVNGVLSVSLSLLFHAVYHGAPRERRRCVLHSLRLFLHIALLARRPFPVAFHAAAGERPA